ncbi:MAG: response regulator, partial [Calditrichaeota bacterium]
DEDSVRELARRFLSEAGYDVHVARNAEEALQVFEQLEGKVDLLITDVVMPGKSGKELHQALAEIRPGLPVVYISGYTDNAIVHRGVLDAETVFLQKPFKPRDLLRKARQALQNR